MTGANNRCMVPLLFVAVLLQAAPAPALPPGHPPLVAAAYVPQRVFDTRQKAFGDFESMLADLTRADAVFVGEQHDDPNTHRLELAIVEGLVRRGVAVVIAMEMFERDVQGTLDQYAAGTITEEQFLKDARPWPRYATDYRPLIEFARAHHLPVLASNVPKRIAAELSKSGLSALQGLGADRRLAARQPECPTTGTYFDRFAAAMGEHAGATSNFYFAQCVKDETMGESVGDAFQNTIAKRVTIVHVNGAFHSDFGSGTAASARRRLPGRRVAVVSVLPVPQLDALEPEGDDLSRADYLVFTIAIKR
ncbi:MAG: ChaN family lipoprotein [Vicinamibacterales bacterium]